MTDLTDQLPEGAMVQHQISLVRYLDPTLGVSRIMYTVDDGQGEMLPDVALALGDIALLHEGVLQTWRDQQE